jgi:hypothetical protein
MAFMKNFGLIGVGSDVQFGKGGARLLQSGGIFQLRNSANDAYVRLEVAATTGTMGANTATSKGYVDAADTAIQTELDLTQTSVGLDASGSLAAWGTTNYLSGATTIRGGILALDAALKTADDGRIADIGSLASRATSAEGRLTTLETRATNAEARLVTLEAYDLVVAGSIADIHAALNGLGSISTAAIQAELDLTQASVGLSPSGSYVAPTSNYLTSSTTVVGALVALDTALKGVDDNLTAVEGAAGLTSDGSLAPFGGPNWLNATTLKGGIEQVGSFAAGVDTNLSAVEASVGLGADGSLVAFSGTMLGGATTVVGAINALRDAADGRLDAAESELTRLNTTLTGNYIHRDGSLSMTGALNLGGQRVTNLPVQAPSDLGLENTDAASIGFVRGQISNLAGAFQYEGTLGLGTIAAQATVMVSSYDAGSYFKVANSGYYSFTGSGVALYANANDGLVKNSAGGWDKVDNTDSTVEGTPNFIAVSGNPDFGFVVDIASTFKDRMTAAEGSIVALTTFTEGSLSGLTTFVNGSLSALTTEVGRVNGSLEARLGTAESRIATAEGSLAYLGTWAVGEFSRVDGSLSAITTVNATQNDRLASLEAGTTSSNASLEARVGSAEARITSAEASLTHFGSFVPAEITRVLGSLSDTAASLTTAIGNVDANLTTVEGSVGLTSNGSLPAFTGSYIASATTVVGAINSLADSVGSLNLAEITARSAADASLQAELDETQVLLGLTGSSGTALPTLVWGTAAPSYLQATTTVRSAIEAVSTSLANLSQDTIRNGTDNVRVHAGTSAVVMSVPGTGGSLATAVEVVGGTAKNTALEIDFGTANEIRFEAAGSAANASIRFVPKGSGQVFIGDTGVAGAVQADTGQDLLVSGGDNGAGAGGSLRLRGGNGNTAGNDGRVLIEGADAAGTSYAPIAFFSSAPAAAYFDFAVGSSAVTITAAGATLADIVLAPAGAGVISASSKRITNVAAPTAGTDAVNRDFMNTAIATASTAVATGAVRTVVATVSADGSTTLGTITGTVLRAKVAITAAFTAGSLTVGRSGNTAEVAADADIDLTATGLYVIENAVDYTAEAILATASSLVGSGSAKVIVEYLQG